MKGQAFTVFKMLIGAVFAVGLLLIVYAVVGGMNYPLSGVGETKNLLLQASRAPGLCFERSIIPFTKDEGFTDAALGFAGRLDLQSGAGIECGVSSCTVKNDIEVPVSAKCVAGSDCYVCFGKPCPCP